MINKSFLFLIFTALNGPSSWAGIDVTVGQEIGYVYQVDTTDPTLFEFNLPSRINGCKSTLYRSKSDNNQVASRKFSLVLSSLVSEKKITFHDTEICENGRSIVGWIRLNK